MATRSAMPVVSTWSVICSDFLVFPLFHPTNIAYAATCLADAPGNPLPPFALGLRSLVGGLINTLHAIAIWRRVFGIAIQEKLAGACLGG
jgi:hypothetical protein